VILANTIGRPWTADGFRSSWGKLSDRAGIGGDLTFHDLRGTAVVRLAIASAIVPQIATFTGHSLKDVEAIPDAHYPGRDTQLAEAAVRKLEARTNCKMSCKTVRVLCGGYVVKCLKSLVGAPGLEPGTR
jgi:integrase